MRQAFKNPSFTLLFIFITLSFSSLYSQKTQRIISLNGAVTEIICALGKEKEIVGRDITSTFPTTLTAKDLGHVRTISIESILALKPTLILATDTDLNPDLLARLKASGIQTVAFKQDYSVEGTKKLILEVAQTVGVSQTQPLMTAIDQKLAQLRKMPEKPKVLFIYARGAGTLMVAGKNTPMDKIINLAGGQNAITEFEDFKPLTAEALLKSNPDYLLFFEKGLESLGGVDGALKLDGVSKTKAGKNKNIIAVDGALLSGFGPRLGEAALILNKLLSGHAK